MNIVITGGSKGIGKGLAKKFAANGHSIVITARTETVLRQTASELDNTGKLINYFPADLSQKTNVDAFAAWLNQEYFEPDVLINNAGDFIPGSVYNEPDGALEKMINTNLYSAYHLTRALLPGMMKRRSGQVINMCSIAALQAYPNGGAYSISKFAMMGFSKNLREEMKPYNIKVTTVYPGAVFTDSWKGSGIEENRIMTVEDIAQTVYMLSMLSPQACPEDVVIRPQLGDL